MQDRGIADVHRQDEAFESAWIRAFAVQLNNTVNVYLLLYLFILLFGRVRVKRK